jgi:MOSC domain-containing protein YiiM
VILEITDVPHTGCNSFAERYGKEALDFINAPERKYMRLRGVYARILNPGLIRVSDFIKKM